MVVGQPGDTPILAEPGLLPTGELPSPDDGLFPRLGFTDFTVEIAQHLPISERAGGSETLAQACCNEPAYFLDEACGPHRVYSLGYPGVERGSVDCDTDLHDIRKPVPVLR